jgi:hypothetical protein
LADPGKAVRLNADAPKVHGQRSVASGVEHVDLTIGQHGVVRLLEGAARLGHGTGITIGAVARDEHALGLRRHASKCGDDEREKKCGLGHVEPLERNEMNCTGSVPAPSAQNLQTSSS